MYIIQTFELEKQDNFRLIASFFHYQDLILSHIWLCIFLNFANPSFFHCEGFDLSCFLLLIWKLFPIQYWMRSCHSAFFQRSTSANRRQLQSLLFIDRRQPQSSFVDGRLPQMFLLIKKDYLQGLFCWQETTIVFFHRQKLT